MKIKAQIVKKQDNAKRPNNNEMVSAFSLVTRMPDGSMREVVTARCYMGRSANASVVYAVLWVRCKDGDWTSGSGSDGEWTSGSGSAGGYGYHKESAALADAVTSAGIKLQDLERNPHRHDHMKHYFDFGGTGSSYYPQVFEAIARAAGYRGRTLFLSH